MRRAWVLAVLAAVLAGVSPVARADVQVDSTVSGHLTVTWHGDTARGCEAAGVCDIAGSLRLQAGFGEGSSTSTSPTQPVLSLLDIQAQPAIVRVVRTVPGGHAGACLDTTGPVHLSLRSAGVARGRLRVALSTSDPFESGLSAGRCTGPLAADLAAALPRAEVRPAALRGGRVRLDFGGRREFTAGALVGTVTSSLVLRASIDRHARTTNPRTETITPEPVRPRRTRTRARTRRVAALGLDFRVVPVDGALTTDFHGDSAPDCETLDACGLTGTHELRVTRGSDLHVEAVLPNPGRAPTVAAALKRLAAGRALSLTAFGEGAWAGQASVATSRDGAPSCRDGRDVEVPSLFGRGRGARLGLSLGGVGSSTNEDTFDSRCPSPQTVGFEQPHTLAKGTLAAAQLAAARVDVPLAAGPVDATGFALTRHGTVNVQLVRTGARVAVETRLEDE